MLIERCNKKWENSEKQTEKYIMSPENATGLMYNLNLSVNQYQEMRLYFKNFLVNLPTRHDVDTFQKKLVPKLTVEETKTYCSASDMVQSTLRSILAAAHSETVLNRDSLKVKAKFGLDGSGSHQIRQQNVGEHHAIETDSSNYIGAFWCPLEVKQGSELIWTNPTPNSILYARPICLMREKESRESVLEHFSQFMTELVEMENGNLNVTVNEEPYNLDISTEFSMCDGKMASILQGDSGAWCHYCFATKNEANDLTLILQKSFTISKTYENVNQIWNELESGAMSYSDPARSGQCHAPILKKDLRYFAILHQKIRSLDHCLKILYHLVAGTYIWSESNFRVRDAVLSAKKEVITSIRQSTGLLLDSPTPIGGNTNTGGVSERFFSPKNRENICRLILNSRDREAYSTLLSYFNQILSVTQNVDDTKIVDTNYFKNLSYRLLIFHKQNFSWATISPSIHQMACHSWELFQMSEGKPIAKFAEHPGEAWNKLRTLPHKSAPPCGQTGKILYQSLIGSRGGRLTSLRIPPYIFSWITSRGAWIRENQTASDPDPF